ncbi:MAG TPA: cytochrome P450 [Candidatus Dormibacteraeota bacterium]|nr:cytochrome P450 [Candidatus Dormibacteraeota bacterium]
MRAREIVDDIAFAIEMLARAAVEQVATGSLFNPKSAELRVDPYPYYRRLRERDPVHRSFGASGWVLTRHDDIVGVLADRAYSSDERNWVRYRRMIGRDIRSGLPDPYADGVISMLRVDPPDHTRLRTLVSKAFTPRAVERLRPRIEAVVVELLDALAGQRELDLMHAFASPLPVVIIGEMLGVAVADRERFRHWSNEAIRLLGDGTRADRRRAWQALSEMRAWLGAQIDARRQAPRDDLLSALVAAEESGDRLSERELFATCVLLLVAGNETTTNLIGNGVVALLRHPDQLARLRRDPAQMPAAVEELVRFDSPVQITSRLVLEERELHGCRLRRGEQIVLVLGAGNRDPARFADPDRLDLDRADARPLSFGHGLHYCLGAQLARLEAQIGLTHLLDRCPDLRFAQAPITWGDNMILRGPRVLPLAA